MTVCYRPQGLKQRTLAIANHLPGGIGQKAGQRLAKIWGQRALSDFGGRLKRLGPSDLCLDLGANVGSFTDLLAATGARVHAFEPDPWSFEKLATRFRDATNVVLHQQAVAATSGTARLRRAHRFAENPERFSHSSSIVRDEANRYGEEGFDVEVVGLADLLQQLGRPVTLAKIDIEGAEFDILEAIFASPADFPIAAIFVETHERKDQARIAQVRRMRKAAETLTAPSINLFWP